MSKAISSNLVYHRSAVLRIVYITSSHRRNERDDFNASSRPEIKERGGGATREKARKWVSIETIQCPDLARGSACSTRKIAGSRRAKKERDLGRGRPRRVVKSDVLEAVERGSETLGERNSRFERRERVNANNFAGTYIHTYIHAAPAISSTTYRYDVSTCVFASCQGRSLTSSQGSSPTSSVFHDGLFSTEPRLHGEG